MTSVPKGCTGSRDPGGSTFNCYSRSSRSSSIRICTESRVSVRIEIDPDCLTPQKRRACGDCCPDKLFCSWFNVWSRLCSGDLELLDIDMYKNLPSNIAGRRLRTA